jgi:hypothetical protein
MHDEDVTVSSKHGKTRYHCTADSWRREGHCD